MHTVGIIFKAIDFLIISYINVLGVYGLYKDS